MLQPPFYLPSKIRMLWVIRFHRSHRLFSRLRNHSTGSLTIPLGDWVFLGAYFKQFSLIVSRCKEKQGSSWDSPFSSLLNSFVPFFPHFFPNRRVSLVVYHYTEIGFVKMSPLVVKANLKTQSCAATQRCLRDRRSHWHAQKVFNSVGCFSDVDGLLTPRRVNAFRI